MVYPHNPAHQRSEGLVRTSRLPVIYIFGRRNVDHRRIVESFYDACSTSTPVVIFQEGCYNHCIRESPALRFLENTYSTNIAALKEAFEVKAPSSTLYSRVPPSYQEPGRPQCSNAASTTEVPISMAGVPDDATVLYIGGETLALTNLLMIHGGKNVRV